MTDRLASITPGQAAQMDEAGFAAVREAKRRANGAARNANGKTVVEKLNRKRNARAKDRAFVRAWKKAHPDETGPAPMRSGVAAEG